MQDTGDDGAGAPGVRFPFALPAGVVVTEVTDEAEPATLHPAEEAMIHPRATARRRREFRMGRAAAHDAIARLGMADRPIGRGSHREPLWPPDVVGSITHGRGIALAAVAPSDLYAGIGVDLEHAGRYFEGLHHRIAFGTEHDRLQALEGEQRRKATVAMFSAKESIYKALFPTIGRYFGFEAAVLSPGSAAGTLVAELDESLGVEGPFEVQFRWAGDLVATAVFVTDPFP